MLADLVHTGTMVTGLLFRPTTEKDLELLSALGTRPIQLTLEKHFPAPASVGGDGTGGAAYLYKVTWGE